MTAFQWTRRFAMIWVGVFFFLIIFLLTAFLAPFSSRYQFISNETLQKICFTLANIYFPYISMGVAGFISLRSYMKVLPAPAHGFARVTWYITLGFNLIIVIITLFFIIDPTSNPDMLLDFLPSFATVFSLLMAGILTYLYLKLS
jgi:hypothetical protein